MESINNAILVHRFMDIEYWVSRCAPGCWAQSSGPGPAQSVQLGEREAGRESGAAGAGLPVWRGSRWSSLWSIIITSACKTFF